MKKSCITLIFFASIIYGAYSLGFSRGSGDNQLPKKDEVAVSNFDDSQQQVQGQTQTNESVPEIINEEPQKNSQGNITHTVQAGETLFLIGLKYDVLWTTIAQANGLDENSALIEGQKIVVPLNSEGNIEKEESLNINEEDARNTQRLVGSGELAWRRDPLEVLRRTAPVDYHLQNSYIYTLVELDKDQGKAIIEVLHDDQKYIFELVQPVEKGDNGVWYILKIKQ